MDISNDIQMTRNINTSFHRCYYEKQCFTWNRMISGYYFLFFLFYVTRKIHVKIVNVFFFLMGSYILSVKKIKNTQNDLSTIPVPYLSYLVNFINFKSYTKQFLIININI